MCVYGYYTTQEKSVISGMMLIQNYGLLYLDPLLRVFFSSSRDEIRLSDENRASLLSLSLCLPLSLSLSKYEDIGERPPRAEREDDMVQFSLQRNCRCRNCSFCYCVAEMLFPVFSAQIYLFFAHILRISASWIFLNTLLERSFKRVCCYASHSLHG